MSCLPLRNSVVLIACLSFLALGYPVGASAGFIGTGQYLMANDRQQRIERVQLALKEERISEQLVAMGVDPRLAEQRVASLTDVELILVAFLVMLILDLTGLTNIFPGIGPGKVR